VTFYVINLCFEEQIVVTLVSRSLSLEGANAFFDVALNKSQVIGCLLLSALYLSFDLVVELLVLHGVLVFDFSNLYFDNLGCFLNLEVSNLRTERLQLFSDILD